MDEYAVAAQFESTKDLGMPEAGGVSHKTRRIKGVRKSRCGQTGDSPTLYAKN